MVTLGILHTTIRGDEKLLLQAAEKHGVKVEVIDVREQLFNPSTYKATFDIALERCVSTVKGRHAVRFLESLNVPALNPSNVATICEDKFLTSLVLKKAGIPTPEFAMVFTEEQALKAVEELGGYPVIMKPPLGSWGRMLAKINDQDALETVIEHKDVLGSPDNKAYYLQQYIKKPGRDIRAFVINGETICAIYRNSPHWITNTARGGKATNCPVTSELAEISKRASDAVGGGMLAMDVFETDDGLMINEINHTMEFKNSEAPTGVSISGAIVDYCLQYLKGL